MHFSVNFFMLILLIFKFFTALNSPGRFQQEEQEEKGICANCLIEKLQRGTLWRARYKN